MLERKNDLPEANGGQAGRVLVDEVPVVHEGRAVREGEALLVERVALVAPAAVLGIPQLLHVCHGLARGRLAPRRVGRRRYDAAEGQEAGNLLLARLHHRHVERLRLAGRVGPRQLARQTALGRVKVGEEEARDDARGPHEEVAQDGGEQEREGVADRREVAHKRLGDGEAADPQLRARELEGLVEALGRDAPAGVVAGQDHLLVGPHAE
mmetsp:Transcript_23820/g.76418  ORF Transcript_23820/g.76418 Transcript_23820/m.76418 type:complete len:210 (+) Transcript_23820:819-1448(+)